MKLYQNDSIKSEVAPLTLEKGNHFSIRAGLQGLVRLSSCWAHSGTQGAKRTETEKDIRTKEKIQFFVPGLPPSLQRARKCSSLITAAILHHRLLQVYLVCDKGGRGWGIQTQFEAFCSYYSHNL